MFMNLFYFPSRMNPKPPASATLQSALLQPLLEVLEFDVYVCSFKGDWKYIGQLFNLDRNPSTEQAGKYENKPKRFF